MKPNVPSTPSILSRRQWLSSASTVAAVAGASFIAAKSLGAETEKPAASGSAGARVYDIRDFGAKGDGKTLDTAALQAAIDACNKDQGGTVLVPAGTFLIGTTELKSNVTLHIAAGGKLLGVADGKQYYASDKIPLRAETESERSTLATLGDGNVGLLFAVNAENVTIEGPGMIDGQGAQFKSPAPGQPSPAGITGAKRPYHMLFFRCNRVTVRNIFLLNCAFHSVRVVQCRFVYLDGISIKGRVISNNDGFHFIACEYVHMTNCDVYSQDDACALFGSCRFITITNCTFSTRWSVFRFGGGVAENIVVSNCILNEVWGCPIKMRCGADSRFENISFSNLVMNNVTGPVSIGLGAQGRRRPNADASGKANAEENRPALPPGIVRNISFSNIRATVKKPQPLTDSEHPSGYNPGEVFSCITLNAYDENFLENISFSNVHVTFPGGGTAEQAAVRDVPKVAGEYYQMGVPPSHALFARNVRGLTLDDVRFELAAPDARPAMVFDHVSDAAVNGLSVQGDKDAESTLRIIESEDIYLGATRQLKKVPVFLQVEGAANANITLDGGDLSKAATPVAFKNGATEKAVTRNR